MHKNIYLFSSSLNYIIFIHLYHFFYHLSLGFDYEFNSLTSASKLSEAYESLSNPGRFQLVFRVLMNYFPILKMIPNKEIRQIRHASHVVNEISTKVVQEKLDKYAKGELGNNKDLLSLLIRANYEETEDKGEQMSFEELKNQVKILFIILG